MPANFHPAGTSIVNAVIPYAGSRTSSLRVPDQDVLAAAAPEVTDWCWLQSTLELIKTMSAKLAITANLCFMTVSFMSVTPTLRRGNRVGFSPSLAQLAL
jgi:hypothetical protein